MASIESVCDIPDNNTVDFISPEILDDYSYYFRKVYLPAAIIRLAQGKNFAGEGAIHMTGRGIVGYHEARDYFHGSPDSDQTLWSLQGGVDDQFEATRLLKVTAGKLPNIAQVIGLRVDPSHITDHYHGKYYTADSANVPAVAVDANSRLGLYRLLGEPTEFDWFVEDIDPTIETALQLRHIS